MKSDFLVARRRNEQKRTGRAWIARLAEATGIQAQAIRLVAADESIRIERTKSDLLERGIATGAVQRVSTLPINSVVAIWDLSLTGCATELVACDMRNHPDFTFAVRARDLLGKLQVLLEFDGDTVGFCSMDLAKGLVVDMYNERGTTSYEVDHWGMSWTSQRDPSATAG